MLIAPSWGGMLNGLLTLRGAWDKVRSDPVLKFMVAALTAYGMATLEGPLLSIKTVNSLSHYTDWTIAHVHVGAMGWNGFLTFSMLYYLFPRLYNTKLWSTKLANYHFWIGMLGIVFYVVPIYIAGVTEGLMWKQFNQDGFLQYPNFLETIVQVVPMFRLRAIGGTLYLAGAFMMAYNLYRTAKAGQFEPDTEAQAAALEKAPVATCKSAFHRLLEGKPLFFTVLATVSILVGNVLLSYIIGWQALYQIVTDPPAQHLTGLAFMVAFSLLFYGIFARFREQACTFICPYGRLQSVLLDENSIVVAYDHKRGEKRGLLQQKSHERVIAGLGDCVACNQCVAVCPTGIDIRDGTQLECVHCIACMDACDAVMTKIGSPRGLIRYASLNGIERGERLRVTPRLAGYCVVLAALVSLLAVMIFTRADAEATLLRAPGSLFQQMPDGHFSNLYTVRIVNKTSRELPVELRLESPAGSLQIMGGTLVVPPQKLLENSLLVELDPAAMMSGTTPVVVGVYAGGKRIQNLKTAFIGPRN